MGEKLNFLISLEHSIFHKNAQLGSLNARVPDPSFHSDPPDPTR